MAIEGGARAGLVAVDQTTIDYVLDRPYSPKAEHLDAAVAAWNELHSDEGAHFDNLVVIDAADIIPQVSWGTSPEMVVAVDTLVPDPEKESDPVKADGMRKALAYMDLQAGTPIVDIPVDKVFIGSCTNSRIRACEKASGRRGLGQSLYRRGL